MGGDIPVSVSLFGHVQFSISYILRAVQVVLAWIPTWLIKWILSDATNKVLREEDGVKIYQTRGGRETHAAHSFDETWWRHRLWVGDIGQVIFKIYLFFRNDSANEKDIFKKLINSAPGSKFIGLAPGPDFQKVEMLAESEKTASLCEMQGLHEVKMVGTFVLASHTEDDEGHVLCRCVWLSGPHTGKTFEFHNPEGKAVKTPAEVQEKDIKRAALQGMYIPPRIVRTVGILIQAVLGASGLMSAIRFVMETFQSFFK